MSYDNYVYTFFTFNVIYILPDFKYVFIVKEFFFYIVYSMCIFTWNFLKKKYCQVPMLVINTFPGINLCGKFCLAWHGLASGYWKWDMDLLDDDLNFI